VESLPGQDIIYQYAYRSRFDEGTPCGMSETALFREPLIVVITPCNLGTSAGCPFIGGTTVQICFKQMNLVQNNAIYEKIHKYCIYVFS